MRLIKRLITYLLIFAQLNLTFHHAYAHHPLDEENNVGHEIHHPINNLIMADVTDTIGTYGASRIGQAYGKGHLDGLTHKIAHGVVGAATGAILKGEKGILPGALGAMSAEVIGDLFLLNASDLEQEVLEDAADRGVLLDPSSDDYRNKLKDKINSKGNWAKMGAAVTALMLDQDVDMAIHTASNAVENNLIPLLLGLATVGSAAWTIYDVVDTYLEEGTEAAVEKLIIDGAITVATGGVAKLAGKGCAKLLPKETIHQLWTKYCTDNPLTAKLINKLSVKPLDHQTLKGVERDIISKEQPWVIRPGQEWKEKIIGKAQKTGTPGHATASYRTAIKEAKKENVDKVYLNRGVKKATGENIGPNTRPDVASVTKDGKVNQFEVPSKTDNRLNLQNRMDIATEKFSPVKQGENKIVDITGSKK